MTKKIQKNEVVKVEKQEVTTRQGGIRGFERVDMQDVTIPRIKVLQAMSPEVKERIGQMGDIIHSATGQITKGEFIPISIWTSQAFFTPRDSTKRLMLLQELDVEDPTGTLTLLCRAKEGKTPDITMIKKTQCQGCEFKEWRGNTPPLCQPTLNILAYLPDLKLPGVIQFNSTNFKYGRKFRDMAAWLGVDLFENKYLLQVKEVSNDKGTFYNTPVKLVGEASDEDYNVALDLFEKMVNANIVTDEDDAPF